MDYLTTATRKFRDDMFDSTLPWQMIDSAAGRVSVIRCVIIYITLPVHPITVQSGILLTFSAVGQLVFTGGRKKILKLKFWKRKNVPLAGQTKQEKSSSQLVNLPVHGPGHENVNI